MALASLPAAVVFDMDGLMLDSERVERWAWRTACAARGYDFDDAFHLTLVGRRDADVRRDLEARFGASFPLVDVQAEAHALWLGRVREHGMPEKPGLAELLQAIDEIGLPKAVATSSIRPRVELSLGALALRFDAIVTGDEVREGKPEPEIYLTAAGRLGVRPGACLALEDSPAGQLAAARAGMVAVLIPDLVEPAVPPARRAGSLFEVRDWLLAAVPGRRLGS
jgi:HAD superfamily hydrolase (TIGR01509 family)